MVENQKTSCGKVLFVITTLNTGGAEISLRKLIVSLIAKRQYEINVVSLSDIGPVGQSLLQAGISVEALNMKPGRPNLLALWRLVRLIRTYQPNVVSTWLYHADLLGGIAARLAGVRSVVWGIRSADVHSDKTKRLTRGVVRVCSMLSSWIPARIACCSLRARDVHVELGYDEGKFHVISNGFDLGNYFPDEEAYVSVRVELGLTPDTPLIGLIARFHPIKNPEGFVEAAATLAARRPDVHFLMVGHGNDATNAALAGWIQQWGLERRVHLLGLRQDIARLSAALDVAALTSWSEAFPTVVGESMACGVPCVVTDVGDAAYIVGDTGLVVPAGDMKGMANGWLQLLSLPKVERRALGQRARQRVADNFDISVMVKRFEAVFAEANQSTQKNKG